MYMYFAIDKKISARKVELVYKHTEPYTYSDCIEIVFKNLHNYLDACVL